MLVSHCLNPVTIIITSTGSCGVAKASLKLMVLLPLSPECWDSRRVPLCLSIVIIFNVLSFSVSTAPSQGPGISSVTSQAKPCNGQLLEFRVCRDGSSGGPASLMLEP